MDNYEIEPEGRRLLTSRRRLEMVTSAVTAADTTQLGVPWSVLVVLHQPGPEASGETVPHLTSYFSFPQAASLRQNETCHVAQTTEPGIEGDWERVRREGTDETRGDKVMKRDGKRRTEKKRRKVAARSALNLSLQAYVT